jgi:hypothetical protein
VQKCVTVAQKNAGEWLELVHNIIQVR